MDAERPFVLLLVDNWATLRPKPPGKLMKQLAKPGLWRTVAIKIMISAHVRAWVTAICLCILFASAHLFNVYSPLCATVHTGECDLFSLEILCYFGFCCYSVECGKHFCFHLVFFLRQMGYWRWRANIDRMMPLPLFGSLNG